MITKKTLKVFVHISSIFPILYGYVKSVLSANSYLHAIHSLIYPSFNVNS